MDFTYYGRHQICFWKRSFLPWENKWETDSPKFSWDDFHLIPQKRIQVEIPKAEYTIVSIPLTSERIDITNYIPGGLLHDGVSGSWDFIVDHTQWGEEQSWIKSWKAFEKYFDGEQFFVELVDDPGTLYNGRLWISEHESEDQHSRIKINYDFTNGPFEMPDDFFYRIRFLDFNGHELQSDLLKHGDTPIFYKTLPGDSTHKFHHWEPAIKPVCGVQDYTASAEILPIYHPIVFYDKHGKEIEERVCVPINMDIVTVSMKPMVETLGIYNIPLEDYWRVPSNMTITATGFKEDAMPYEIRVISEPDKTSYRHRETIDYTGLVVKAYKQNGNLWTAGLFDDGTIPISFLILPVQKANRDDLEIPIRYRRHGITVETSFFISINEQ